MSLEERTISFAASHLHWLTRTEASHGWFQLDALLRVTPAGAAEPLAFALAASVPAGRMYASIGPLLKQPPYSFQLIAGPHEHTVLRRPLGASNPAMPADTSQPHSELFESLRWYLAFAPGNSLQPGALASLNTPPPSLNIVLDHNHNGARLRLEAPLRHWNHRPNPAGWQLETGPLLWPLDLQAFLAAPRSELLTIAWLHANQTNRVTMSGDRLPAHELEAKLSLLALC
jgi:hypothetical protein